MRNLFLLPILAISTAVLVSCSATQSKNKSFLTSYQGFEQDSKFNNQTTYRGNLEKLPNYDSVYLEKITALKPQKMEEMGITPNELTELEKPSVLPL